MTRIDDKILLRRYHEEGDLQAREKLIEQYMSLVRSLARRYSYRGEQLEDLILDLLAHQSCLRPGGVDPVVPDAPGEADLARTPWQRPKG